MPGFSILRLPTNQLTTREQMDVTVRRADDGFRFEGIAEGRLSVLMDNGIDDGGKGEAPSPLQVLLMTLGGCSGIDVVSILNKSKQAIDNLEIQLHADRVKKGFISPFEHVHVHFKLDGTVETDKAVRAIRLSLGKYCTVSHMLREAATITASVSVNGADTIEVDFEN